MFDLKQFREDNKLTQYEFSQKLAVPQSLICKWEKKGMSFMGACFLSRMTGRPFEEFLDYVNRQRIEGVKPLALPLPESKP